MMAEQRSLDRVGGVGGVGGGRSAGRYSPRNANLRHVSDLSADLIARSPLLHSLWLGPVFRNDQVLLEVLRSLPPTLRQLDLDLTQIFHLVPTMSVTTRTMPSADGNESEFSTLVTAIMTTLWEAVGQHLTSWSLRFSGPVGVVGWVHALDATSFGAVSCNLQVLDFRGNHMGPHGISVLARALTRSSPDDKQLSPTPSRLPNLHRLILSWNKLNDECVEDAVIPMMKSLPALEWLDLSCNTALTNQSLMAFVTSDCLGANSQLSSLVLFGCRNLDADLSAVEAAVISRAYDVTSLQMLDLQGTEADLADWPRLEFVLRLNRACRGQRQRILALAHQPSAPQTQMSAASSLSSSLSTRAEVPWFLRHNLLHDESFPMYPSSSMDVAAAGGWWKPQTRAFSSSPSFSSYRRSSSSMSATSTTADSTSSMSLPQQGGTAQSSASSIAIAYQREESDLWNDPTTTVVETTHAFEMLEKPFDEDISIVYYLLRETAATWALSPTNGGKPLAAHLSL